MEKRNNNQTRKTEGIFALEHFCSAGHCHKYIVVIVMPLAEV
jgi:hypothetical protein